MSEQVKGPIGGDHTEINVEESSGPTLHPRNVLVQDRSWRNRLHGWRFGIFSGAILATVVFLINLIVTVVTLTKHEGDKYRKILYQGGCDKTNHLDLVAHLIINLLSTLLLGASNYAMQCLSSPTRAEVDAAHSKRQWLDIGVLSFRNIKNISATRALLWWLLGLSSFPLHLFYNSAVFSTIVVSEYAIFSVDPSMLTNSSAARSAPLGFANETNIMIDTFSYNVEPFPEFVNTLYANAVAGRLENLTVSECLKQYAVQYQTTNEAVILVSENVSTQLHSPAIYDPFWDLSVPHVLCPPNPYSWICGVEPSYSVCEQGPICSEHLENIDKDDWSPFGNRVSYCLSAAIPQQCQLEFTLPIAWVVIVFNFIKAVVLFIIFIWIGDDPIITVGDAVSSFLQNPDKNTQNLCLMSKRHIDWWHMPAIPRPYGRFVRGTWSNTVSASRWVFCLALYALAILICIGLLIYGFVKTNEDRSAILSVGLGDINPLTFIEYWSIPSEGISGVLGNAFVANSPQVILSAIYFTYNGLFTCFMVGVEWDRYAKHRKGLRVSSRPAGSQRSTYFLQLPYRFGIPLMLLSGVLHWLTSESIYLVSVAEQGEGEYLTCGFSPPAIITVIALGLVMIFVVTVAGRTSLDGGLPVAPPCSAAISAACHIGGDNADNKVATARGSIRGVLNRDTFPGMDNAEGVERGEEAAFLPLKWGVTRYSEDVIGGSVVGHCTFSSREVEAPRENTLYAG